MSNESLIGEGNLTVPHCYELMPIENPAMMVSRRRSPDSPDPLTAVVP